MEKHIGMPVKPVARVTTPGAVTLPAAQFDKLLKKNKK